MHLGNAWTAVLAWLSARNKGGAVVLRMEDLDPDRSKEHFAREILDDMAWLGLDWDEGPDKGGPCGPYRQSKRRGYYQSCLDRLEEQGLLYPCWCTRAELRPPAGGRAKTAGISCGGRLSAANGPLAHGDGAQARPGNEDEPAHALIAQAPHAGEADPPYAGTCLRLPPEVRAARAAAMAGGRAPALRVKAGGGRISFIDQILGPCSQDLASDCGDFVLRRSDGVHAYQLAVSADDAAQCITEVVRGADLLESTPRQIYLQRLFGWPQPAYAHVPLLVDPDGRRLSKRRGDVDLGLLRSRGVAPGTVMGYLAWKAGLLNAPHPVSPLELIDGFSFQPLPRGPVVVEEHWLAACP
jgi:glutamyl-tRNA synthetase